MQKIVFNSTTAALTKGLLYIQTHGAYKSNNHHRQQWIDPCSAAEIYISIKDVDLRQSVGNQERVDEIVATFTGFLESYKEFQIGKNQRRLGSSEIQVHIVNVSQGDLKIVLQLHPNGANLHS